MKLLLVTSPKLKCGEQGYRRHYSFIFNAISSFKSYIGTYRIRWSKHGLGVGLGAIVCGSFGRHGQSIAACCFVLSFGIKCVKNVTDDVIPNLSAIATFCDARQLNDEQGEGRPPNSHKKLTVK